MLGPDPRTTLVWALLLDWLGQFLILALILWIPVVFTLQMGGTQLTGQYPWLLFPFCCIRCWDGYSVATPFCIGVACRCLC